MEAIYKNMTEVSAIDVLIAENHAQSGKKILSM